MHTCTLYVSHEPTGYNTKRGEWGRVNVWTLKLCREPECFRLLQSLHNVAFTHKCRLFIHTTRILYLANKHT